ncbi:hypothetical protein PN4B1_49020 [Paenibacillus naphthalenovorans]|uniref:DUF5677 domain-containing protein n=1 Tax=Paenibacillus naphthalenovorans TaxID=162209 RepID=UPI0010BC3E00|nr:DUF5677 domain-containing protein [Paenibacillus naphthalenovorans]GCL74916.1 hypothetical protein PN4B1_49020 [Paenibacillus naphthalenovorans]
MFEHDRFLKIIDKVIQENPKIKSLCDDEIESLVSKVIENTIPETSSMVLDTLKKNSMEMLEERRLLRTEFEARLQRRWSKPLNLLETLIVISSEAGESCYEQCIDKSNAEDNLIFQVLIKIHARACQISHEVLSLLRGGFADGAMTRWRTLHELAVLAFFINQNSNEVAKMYLEYEYVERYYEMVEYIQHAKQLGYEELTPEEIEEITSAKNDLVSRYGSDYEKPYGWTMKVLPRKDRNFKGIEETIQLGHLRPNYKLACNYVHLGPKASSFSLGVMDGSNLMLAGASNYGLAAPGQNTSLSLTQISANLLTVYPTYERLMVTNIMSFLVEEICSLFVEVQREIEDEEMVMVWIQRTIPLGFVDT